MSKETNSLETAESWQRTHAALLKSVAESQGKLLAALNIVETVCDAMRDEHADLKVLIAQTQAAVRNSHGTLTGRLDAIGAVLAELLSPKQPPSKRRKR